MKKNSSLRRDLWVRTLLVVLPIVTVGMIVHWLFERRLLEQQFHEALAEDARILATLVTRRGEELELEFADEFMPQYSQVEEPSYFQIWHPDGRPLERSFSLGGVDLPFRYGSPEKPERFSTSLPSGASVRCVGIAFPARLGAADAPAAAASAVIVVGADAARFDAILRRGYVQVALTGLVASACIALFVFLALRRGMRLLERVARDVGGIDPSGTAAPLDPDIAPLEIRPVIEALNASSRRMRGFIERERRFTADVAHELRTPIAELRATAEVAARWPDDEGRERLARDALSIALQMGSLVESLLELAQIEGEGPKEAVSAVDLCELTRRVAEQALKAAPVERALELTLPPALAIASRPKLLELTLRNLFQNAFRHASGDGPVRARVAARGAHAALEIANPASRLEPGDLERCTERFWRGARTPSAADHFGLGLSIVEAACARLGCRFSVRLADGVFLAYLDIPPHC